MSKFKLGRWYESKGEVRRHYGEYWKGILLRKGELGLIYAFHGARRVHYGDGLDYKKGEILYVGEGKRGNQALTPRNRALVEAHLI